MFLRSREQLAVSVDGRPGFTTAVTPRPSVIVFIFHLDSTKPPLYPQGLYARLDRALQVYYACCPGHLRFPPAVIRSPCSAAITTPFRGFVGLDSHYSWRVAACSPLQSRVERGSCCEMAVDGLIEFYATCHPPLNPKGVREAVDLAKNKLGVSLLTDKEGWLPQTEY